VKGLRYIVAIQRDRRIARRLGIAGIGQGAKLFKFRLVLGGILQFAKLIKQLLRGKCRICGSGCFRRQRVIRRNRRR
jgi:hypothetical protein